MKYFLAILVSLIFSTMQSQAQSTFTVMKDISANNAKMLKGLVSKSDIANEPEFTWYAQNYKQYTRPDTAAVNAMSRNKEDIYFIIFGGTWCSDTHFVLPRFFKLQEESGFPEERMTIYASDRNKHTTGTIAQAFNALNVPTIIVMKDGKELGRVVEQGKTGRWDRELADIINQ